MTFSYNIIFFLILIILSVIIYNQYDVIKHYKSNIEYYKWHDSIFDPPKSTSWYLVQTNDNEKKIKVLFYKASEDLIGFPVRYNSNDYRENTEGFVIFKINLENNEFAEYGKIMEELDYRTDVERVIYIEDKLYTLSRNYIISYDLNTLEQINKVELSQTEEPLTDTIWLE